MISQQKLVLSCGRIGGKKIMPRSFSSFGPLPISQKIPRLSALGKNFSSNKSSSPLVSANDSSSKLSSPSVQANSLFVPQLRQRSLLSAPKSKFSNQKISHFSSVKSQAKRSFFDSKLFSPPFSKSLLS